MAIIVALGGIMGVENQSDRVADRPHSADVDVTSRRWQRKTWPESARKWILFVLDVHMISTEMDNSTGSDF